jgi:starch-binding outer membrane protein, SusD/RagB family
MNTSRSVRRLAAAALLFGVAASSSACDFDELLNVEDRVTVPAEALQENIGLAISGAIGNFHGAYDGFDTYVAVSALLADEFYSSGTFPTRTATDRRSQQFPASGNTSDAAYDNLQYARRALNDAAAGVAEHPDYGPNSATLGQLKALEGYTLIALGEGFCSAVPLSTGNVANPAESEMGVPQTSRQVMDAAIVRFDASLTAGANHLASIGKARALLFQGHYAQAATAVAAVPMDYVYHIAHSESGGQNQTFGIQGNGRYSLSDGEGTGGNTVEFLTQGARYTRTGTLVTPGDDRSPWWGPRNGFDATIPQYVTLLYNGVADNTPLASGVEAWLIRAEALAQANATAGDATALLNELRQNADDLMQGLHEWPVHPDNDLADLPVATTSAEAVAQVLNERAFWLLLTGHRLGDLRRAVNQYGIDMYPTGAYHKGGVYGNDVVFPLDFDETNNPNFTLDMCDVTSTSID